MTLTDDIAALCRAIDGGDDSALPILADALEEAEDTRAAGMRLAGDRRPMDWSGQSWWVERNHRNESSRHDLPPATLLLLAGGELATARHEGWVIRHRSYSSRSAAYLALAEALS